MDSDAKYGGKWHKDIVRAVKKRLNMLRQATCRQDLSVMNSLQLKKRQGEEIYQIRVNDQYRFLIEFRNDDGKEAIYIIGFGDLH